MPQPNEPAIQEPAAPATPAEPAQPADNPAPAAPAADEGQPAAEPAAPAPDAQPTPGDGGDGQQPPQQSRQERRDQERGIRQLNQQVKQGQQPNQPQFGGQQSPQFPQYADGQTVSSQQLQQDVVQTASAIADLQVTQRLQQHDAARNFDQDVETIPTKFAELNPDNAAYTPEMDEAIAQEYQERAFKVIGMDAQGQPIRQLDPTVRLSSIAERHVKAARAYAAKASASQQTAVDQAADSAAPRPTGAKPSEKPFESLTLAEMKARVGYHKA